MDRQAYTQDHYQITGAEEAEEAVVQVAVRMWKLPVAGVRLPVPVDVVAKEE